MGVLSSCCIAALLHVLPTFLQGNDMRLFCRHLLLSCKAASTFASDMMQSGLHFAALLLAGRRQRCGAQVLSRPPSSRILHRAFCPSVFLSVTCSSC